MADITLEQVRKLAEQLDNADRQGLIARLKTQPTKQVFGRDNHCQEQTREELITKLRRLRDAGALDYAESLYGKYANPNIPDITEERLHADLHRIATEREQELDDFNPDADLAIKTRWGNRN